jgi:hypothetical protein
MHRKMPDGSAMYKHLTVAARRPDTRGGQRAIADLTPPPMLEHFRYLWDWTLAAVRGMTPGKPHLSWADISAWASTFGIAVAPWEADAMVSMADAYFAAAIPPEPAKA